MNKTINKLRVEVFQFLNKNFNKNVSFKDLVRALELDYFTIKLDNGDKMTLKSYTHEPIPVYYQNLIDALKYLCSNDLIEIDNKNGFFKISKRGVLISEYGQIGIYLYTFNNFVSPISSVIKLIYYLLFILYLILELFILFMF